MAAADMEAFSLKFHAFWRFLPDVSPPDLAVIAMTAFIYLLPQKRWWQSGPCWDAEFRVLGFGRMAHAVGPRSRRH